LSHKTILYRFSQKYDFGVTSHLQTVKNIVNIPIQENQKKWELLALIT